MSFYEQMRAIHNSLNAINIASILPADDEGMVLKLSAHQFEGYKRAVSFRYLEKIRGFNTWGVLVINHRKHNINDYIGPNTFAEIAVAFSNRKKVYLLFGIPSVYEDELRAWRAIPLNGKLPQLITDYNRSISFDDQQLSLFPND